MENHTEYSFRPLDTEEELFMIGSMRLDKLMQWIREREEELKRLQEIERQFMKTRNIELLKPFYGNFEHQKVELKDYIEKPVALFD